MKKGIFITFEGIDGCGKSTQSKLVYGRLKKNGYRAIFTREPGGTKLSECIRRILLNPRNEISPLAELFLYESGRAEHVKKTILPAIRSRSIVICDRFFDATTAYQGYGRGLDIKMIEKLNYFASQGIVPDLTILLDIPASEGLKRAKKLNKHDRMEKERSSFYDKVRRGYLALAKKFPKRIRIVKTSGTIEETNSKILSIIKEKYGI